MCELELQNVLCFSLLLLKNSSDNQLRGLVQTKTNIFCCGVLHQKL